MGEQRPTAERNLLFGILALQNNFIDRSSLLAAFNAWVSDKSGSLGGVLVSQGALDERRRELVDSLVAAHLESHDADVRKSLADLSDAGGVCADLEKLRDRDLTVSLANLRGGRPSTPPMAVGIRRTSGARFTKLQFHAEGGLGCVYVARDEELGRNVAVKEIQSSLADDEACRQRFLIEAEITGALEHPCVVPIYSLNQYEDGRPYYAMRFIEGESLKEAVEKHHLAHPKPDPGTVGFRTLLTRFIDVCEAVAYAHSRGVLHRDLKPQNIMLGRFGEALIIDWGLAKATGSREPAAVRFENERTLVPQSGSKVEVTQAGSAIGTPAYMSPEQALGNLQNMGPATDVYGLGATLFQLLCGRPPVEHLSTEAALERIILGEIAAPRSINPRIPRPLDAICRKAMEREPRNRYATASELAVDLERWLAGEPVQAYRETWPERFSRWVQHHRSESRAALAALVTATAAALIAATLLGLSYGREQESRKSELRLAAIFAAKTVATDIDLRRRILISEARDPELRLLVIGAPADVTAGKGWNAGQSWVQERFETHEASTQATSWFVADVRGRQLMRWPKADTIGKDYAFRDYFHGTGHDLTDQEVLELSPKPIRSPHVSNPYRSEATGQLMVAFSVPIWSAPESFTNREVLGILGMSVELGSFTRLRFPSSAEWLGQSRAIVLLEATSGDILHHPLFEDLPSGSPWVPRIDGAQIERLQTRKPMWDYIDPAGEQLKAYAGRWIAAYAPVELDTPDKPFNRLSWAVIVQARP